MMSSGRIPLAFAKRTAEAVLREIGPHCLQSAIAGSIRRECETVGDIDLVLLPASLKARILIRDRVMQSCQLVKDGEQELVARMSNGVQLDIWMARLPSEDLFKPVPTNYGTLLLCRTGSIDFNKYLIERAKQLGLVWSPHVGVMRGDQVIASETEEDIFHALSVEPTRPEDR